MSTTCSAVFPRARASCLLLRDHEKFCTETRTIRIRNEGARATTGDLTLTFARLTRTGDIFNAPPPFLMGSITLEPGLAIDVPVQFCNRSNDPTDGLFTINSSAPRNPTVVVTLVNPLNRRCP